MLWAANGGVQPSGTTQFWKLQKSARLQLSKSVDGFYFQMLFINAAHLLMKQISTNIGQRENAKETERHTHTDRKTHTNTHTRSEGMRKSRNEKDESTIARQPPTATDASNSRGQRRDADYLHS